MPILLVCSGFEGIAQGCSCFSSLHKPEPKPEMHWISCADPIGLRRATESAHLAWLLSVVSPKPDPHVRDRDVEETTKAER